MAASSPATFTGVKGIRKRRIHKRRHLRSSSSAGAGTAPSARTDVRLGEDRGTQGMESCEWFVAMETADSTGEGWVNMAM